ELHHAWQIDLRTNLAEVRGGDVRTNASEANRIEKIENVRAKRQTHVLSDLKIPRDAQVLIGEVRVAQSVRARRRCVAVGERSRRDKRILINVGIGAHVA